MGELLLVVSTQRIYYKKYLDHILNAVPFL